MIPTCGRRGLHRIAPAVILVLLLATARNPRADATVTSGAVAPAAAVAQAGGWLTLVRDQDVLVRDPNGEERLLVRSPADALPAYPIWSPDGSRIAYVQKSIAIFAETSWGDDIYVVDADGANLRMVYEHDRRGARIEGLAWMPDGASLLLGYQATLIEDGRFRGQIERVERLDLATGERRLLVDGAALPSISRDGTRLAFLRQDTRGAGALWVSGPDGSDAVEVLQVGLGTAVPFVLGPRLSPDGGAIVFAAPTPDERAPEPGSEGGGTGLPLRELLRGGAAHGLPMDLWRVDVPVGALHRLTFVGEDDPYPAWTPDGTTIIALATGGLYELRADGSALRRLGPGAFGGQLDVR